MAEKLSRKQARFTRKMGVLLAWANEIPGVYVVAGEWWRSPALARLYAEQGIGIRRSLHCLKLAVDLALFVNGKYITDGTHPMWLVLGEAWEAIGGTWGGRFPSRDSNHFSLEHNGVR